MAASGLRKGATCAARPTGVFPSPTGRFAAIAISRARAPTPRNAAEALVPRFGMRNQVQVTPPGGMYGARGSRLMQTFGGRT